jgi:hypothetical protein
MRDAIALIQQHVGPNYEIIDRRQVAVAPPNQSTQTAPGASAQQNTEYQITYRKLPAPPYSQGGASPNASAPAPGTVQAQQQWSLVPSVQPANGVQGTGSGVQPVGGTTPRFGN